MEQVIGLNDAINRMQEKLLNIGNGLDTAIAQIQNLEQARIEAATEIRATGRIAAIENKLSESYDTLVAGVTQLQSELEGTSNNLDRLSAAHNENMRTYEEQFGLHNASIEQIKADLISKTSRLEGAISGAFSHIGSQQGGGSEARESKFTLDSEKKFDVMPKHIWRRTSVGDT